MISLVKLTTPSMEVYDLSEENELDTYMSREVLVLEGDEAKDLHMKKLVMEKRIIVDSIKGSPYPTSVISQDT